MRGHIRRVGKSWETLIYLGKDAQGHKCYHSRTKSTKAEAERYVAEFLHAHFAGDAWPTARMTTAEFLKLWLEKIRSACRPHTYVNRLSAVRRHYLPAFGHVRLDRLTPLVFQTAYEGWLRAGMHPNTVRHHHTELRAAMNAGLAWKLLSRIQGNPTRGVKLPAQQRRVMTVWDDEQLALFIAAAWRTSRFALIFELAIALGCRIGEILALHRTDIDWRARVLSLQRTVSYTKATGHLLNDVKTHAGRRPTLLPVEIMGDLRAHVDALPPGQAMLFRSVTGKQLHESVVGKEFHRIRRRAGLPKIRVHDLRHSRATFALSRGASIKAVQELLGHARAETTLNVYAHVLPSIQRDLARDIGRRLFASRKRDRHGLRIRPGDTEHPPARGQISETGPDRS